MTEREKQLAGELYCHQDEEIGAAFMRCSKLVHEFNSTAYDEEESRQRIIRELLHAKGTFHIEHGFLCVFGSNITIGNNFFANYNVQLLDPNRIEIGDDVLLAPNVIVCTAGHPVDPALREGGTVIYLYVAYKEVERRVINITTRGIVIKQGRSLKDAYEERLPLYHRYSDIVIDCSSRDIEGCVGEMVAKLCEIGAVTT